MLRLATLVLSLLVVADQFLQASAQTTYADALIATSTITIYSTFDPSTPTPTPTIFLKGGGPRLPIYRIPVTDYDVTFYESNNCSDFNPSLGYNSSNTWIPGGRVEFPLPQFSKNGSDGSPRRFDQYTGDSNINSVLIPPFYSCWFECNQNSDSCNMPHGLPPLAVANNVPQWLLPANVVLGGWQNLPVRVVGTCHEMNSTQVNVGLGHVFSCRFVPYPNYD